MQARLDRAVRLLRLQDRMHRLAERELALLERRVQAADAAQRDLIRALNEASAFHEPLRATAVGRLKSLAVAAQDLRGEREAAAQRLLDRAAQHKRTGAWAERLETEHRQHAEIRDWAERLDLLTAPEASLRSARPVSPVGEPSFPAAATGPAGPDGLARGGPPPPDLSAP
ncbi:hypothetical protein [Methylobacterium longum]|uniref:Flagellar FliJ protein n=1 Tax=Methylobacterium longum TaxID=767694 RepID=A0ABT8AQ28_9HYPH|nr:hypothetical protein [Methylobacterium longum]MDN3571661.1 hypothetical protein [Methylobacterium longum]GJE11675.1 hypothetical protein FOHLNKBM_2719 [Methylobacterium longum]